MTPTPGYPELIWILFPVTDHCAIMRAITKQEYDKTKEDGK